MILWHAGVATFVVYATLGRRRIDYRFILLGAVLPDGVDAILNATWLHEPAGRSVAHALVAVIAVAVTIILVFRAERRLAVFGVAVGWLLHLVGDGMWQAPRTFYWPAFGTDFALRPAEPYTWELFTRPLDHALTWGGEIAGAGVLVWFWIAFRLGDAERRRLFLRDGLLRA
jgi:LexA-binding, inner membrane-associated putative hydrolase